MSVTSVEFKQTLGRFLSGVTVIAAEVAGSRHGMTASAFLSVSLDPPLVLVSIGKSAHMHAVLAAGVPWSASILAGDQAALSNHFAGYGEADVRWILGDLAPRIDGALAWVQCASHSAHDAGDHTLFVGHVLATGWRDAEPLTYFRGKYRELLPG